MWQPRFQHHLQAFQDVGALVMEDNERAVVPDLTSYNPLRQESSCEKISLYMIEYAVGLHITDDVCAHPVHPQLRKNTCDIMPALDIAGIAGQAMSNRHNLMLVIKAERRATLQSAIAAVGALVKKTVGVFLENKQLLSDSAKLHAFGLCVDADVWQYVRGMRDCIVGLIYWLYERDRSFSEAGDKVRDLGWVFLPPRSGA
ncbi:hypothetical protein FOMPIDRAFT_1132512 [Fomitopsis schrenkii]|uniref:Uncharacterized protein n=1 Tax=Fomitopsis schrenkii TaxID=2126942 RepID=S8F0Q7_FOMSC|nr:hypothetical protein FOMPIDRAFT_1132512 [Fomitopsis schrenkii]